MSILKFTQWSYQEEQQLLKYLKKNSDSNYRKFNQKIVKPTLPMIGVRAPILKRIAKQIAHENFKSYLSQCQHNYYEQVLVHGLVLGGIHSDFQLLCRFITDFIPQISDWCVCDMTCTNLKVFKKHPKAGFDYARQCIESKNEWQTRFGLVIMLCYFIDEEHLDLLLEQSKAADNLRFSKSASSFTLEKPAGYFVQMANAWLISYCYIQFPKQTLAFLKSACLQPKTIQMALQKIRDSRQVNAKDKQYISSLNLTKKQ